ncbi:hypothetical protein F3Y22_tig00110020pilonHSYRG00013 [Hibiscus syriacus]|uniref:Uncharacterized protein n=1 Tax=Hibiscus syriacus TaxID=106335 RepID=A0A6A3BL86_HIBSY|nr:hypothetical protein F3Y22_tig00110020pilonHSYRG00013 [Hibiscus syriacus]
MAFLFLHRLVFLSIFLLCFVHCEPTPLLPPFNISQPDLLKYFGLNNFINLPTVYVFVDSYIDAGNNNYLKTIAKANYLPYGIDFTNWLYHRWENRC